MLKRFVLGMALGAIVPVTLVAHHSFAAILPITWTGFAYCSSLRSREAVCQRGFLVEGYAVGACRADALIFHVTVFRRVGDWNESLCTPTQAKIAGVLSMTFWSGVIIAGRVIAYY
jgi:hypothetical protein